MFPKKSHASRDTPRQHKQRMEKQIVLASIALQATLTLSVVGFCMHELSRCDINVPDASGGGSTCPRALYTNIITGTVAMWFPSPYYGLINGIYGVASDGGRGVTRSVKKKTTVENDIEEEP